MVEVDEVADGVDGGEEQGGAGADLVELQTRVQRDVLRMTMMVELVMVMMVGWLVGDGDDNAGADIVEAEVQRYVLN